jgi:hypothetical protein
VAYINRFLAKIAEKREQTMHEEQLFEMVNEAVLFAQSELERQQSLTPFAMLLYRNGYIESLKAPEGAQGEQYDALVATLREKVTDAPKVTGVAIVAAVTIPAQYKPPVESGIRVHLEERHKCDEKIGGRFLYVPYQLYKESDDAKVQTHLYNPIPVGIPQEIFTKEC